MKNPVFGGMVFASKIHFSSLEVFPTFGPFGAAPPLFPLKWQRLWLLPLLGSIWPETGMVCLSSIFLAWLVPGILNIPLSKMVGNQVGWPPNHYMENGSFTKHNPFKKSGCLGYQVVITSILVRYDHWSKISEVWHPDLASISQVVKWPLYMSHGKKTLTFHWILVV